jgi:hypothetical protein
VELAGIAYSMAVAPRQTKLKLAVGDVSVNGAAVLMSAGKKTPERKEDRSLGDEMAFGLAYLEQTNPCPMPDDYRFCASVRDVMETEIAGIPVWKCRTAPMRIHDGRQEVKIDIYATPQSLRDGSPLGPRDETSGTLWLQGTLPL